MANPFEDIKFCIPRVAAGADLSAAQYKAVKLNASGDVILAAAAGEVVVGVLQNNPVSGLPATVGVLGVTKMVAGTGGVAPMNKVETSATGTGVVATADSVSGAAVSAGHVLGIALTSALAGELFSLLLLPIGAQATTAV